MTEKEVLRRGREDERKHVVSNQKGDLSWGMGGTRKGNKLSENTIFKKSGLKPHRNY